MTTTRQEQGHVVSTPTVREAGRRARYWVIAGVIALVIVLIILIATGAARPAGPPLSATNPAPDGGKAVAEVLRDRGVDVTATDTMLATRAAATDPDNTTLFLIDTESYLDADQLHELEGLATRLVIMTPSFDQLDALAPEVALAGDVAGTLDADCELPSVARAETVTGDGSGYRVIDEQADTVTCLGSGDGIHSLIEIERGDVQTSDVQTGNVQTGDRNIVIVGLRDAFTNGHVAEHGNAALALGLLGAHENLVWLIPSITESHFGPGIAELTPPWVSPVMVLAILTTIAAAIWRGRRFGPLVIENLPVVVRASETMEGRARLYETSSARLRALDALRIGTIDRLGTLCGLPRSATTDEIIHAVSAAVGAAGSASGSATGATTGATTGGSVAEVSALLRDTEPTNDTELVRLSDELLTLERDTEAALRPVPSAHPPTQPNERTGTVPGEPGE